MKKILAPIIAVAVLGVTGVILATAGLSPPQDNFELAWSSPNQDWEGVTYAVDVTDTESDKYYILMPTEWTFPSGGPLSEVRMSVDGGTWTTGPWGSAAFKGKGGKMDTVMTAKCDDPEEGGAEGWAKLELFWDEDEDGFLDPGESTPISAILLHGTSEE